VPPPGNDVDDRGSEYVFFRRAAESIDDTAGDDPYLVPAAD